MSSAASGFPADQLLFDGYAPGSFYDELIAPNGQPRPCAAPMYDQLANMPLEVFEERRIVDGEDRHFEHREDDRERAQAEDDLDEPAERERHALAGAARRRECPAGSACIPLTDPRPH